MGACSSCLGLNRRSSQSDPSDTSQLLGEAYPHYGGTITSGAPAADPEEIRRTRDMLERLCVATSDKLIDVSTATRHPDVSESSGFKPTHEYPRIFSERFAHLHEPAMSEVPSRSTSITQYNAEASHLSHTSSRPASSGPSGSHEEEGEVDEQTWLENVLRETYPDLFFRGFDKQNDDEDVVMPWDEVVGANEFRGQLTMKLYH